jgi:predicted DNA-binding WGR domain protein
MVKQLLSQNIKESIGIVAFSQEQQGVIEDAIINLATADKKFDELLELAYNRKDEGQYTGLFIKNLENVQGDERDIIIMSVCYGHDSNKKMLMNFGPINKKGGEKRLNVIFSRAKKHMAIVSSIRHHHITNDYNEGANYFKRFLQYTEMVSIGNMSHARTILDSLITSNKRTNSLSELQSITTQQIKNALEARDYIVDEKIGQSSFKCSLGVKQTIEDNHYIMGILIDNEDHYKNDDLVEQYFQRPSILRSFGWNVMNVYTKDWLLDQDRVINMIMRNIENKDGDETLSEYKNTPSINVADKPRDLFDTMLRSEDGKKFWEIAQDNMQIKIRYGKIGSKGQIEIKSFNSESNALEAKEQLINKQLEMGYRLE